MSHSDPVTASGETEAGISRFNTAMVVSAALLGLAAVAVAAVVGVLRFVDTERARDLRAWQVRLGIVAESRTASVEDWLAQQFDVVQGLAENASLQLYMTEISFAGDAGQDLAEADYLKNLLVVTAERTGFTGRAPATQVRANVERVGTAGLALIAAAGQVLVATPAMPPVGGAVAAALTARAPGQAALIDLHLGPDGRPAIGFIAPVFAIQADPGTSAEIGVVVGLRSVGDDLYDRLKQPGETNSTAESYLVRRTGETIEYLTPLADGTRPLERRLAADTAELAAALAITRPGAFGRRVDYANRPVLVTGRALARAPWTLVRAITVAEALAETEERGRVLLIILLGAIVIVVVAILAVWRHGTSVRAARAAERFQTMAERFENLSKFMRVVTDSQPTAIAAIDDQGHYRFANRRSAEGLGIDQQDMIGKTMAQVIGPTRARVFDGLNRRALESGQPVTEINEFDDGDDGDDGGPQVIKSDHIPLKGDRDNPPGVLLVLEDVSQLMAERARRERILRQLVTTIVTVVDKRDPWSAHHSERVAAVAGAIGREMGLDPVTVDTVEIAGAVMNLGKILVPKNVLTKTEKLSEAEMAQVRDSILTSAELMAGIEFDGPVGLTLGQLQERPDGAGTPAGLTGEAILESARVVAVANAFVAMVSARSWRPGLDFDKALEALMADAGTRFDRRPVAALVNYVDNRGGRAEWAHFAEPPEIAEH